MKLFTYSKSNNDKVIRLMGIPLYHKRCFSEGVSRKILGGLITKQENGYVKKYYLLGILVCRRKNRSVELEKRFDEIGKLLSERFDEIDKLLSGKLEERFDEIGKLLSGKLDNTRKLLVENHGKVQNSLAELGRVFNFKNDIIDVRMFIDSVQAHYVRVKKDICDRIKKGKKLRFASYVVYDTTYGAHGIVELMLKEPHKYEVKFVICPDVFRDKDFVQYRKVRMFFIERYGSEYVLDGYDEHTCRFIDWSGQFDIIYMANQYDSLVNEFHKSSYLCKREVLPIHLNYCFRLTKWSSNSESIKKYSCFYYKYFVNTPLELSDMANCRVSLCDNLVVSGYPKMDVLNQVQNNSKQRIHKRKRILVSPHHTVGGTKNTPSDLKLSNFLIYYDFITVLPDLYPDVDFVFRPHPLLFSNLVLNGIWTQQRVNAYLDTLASKNIEYSNEADYLHLFEECDAIIHDCGSFMVEWLFTGKPCCFVVEDEESLKKQLNFEGLIAIEQHVLAKSKEEICKFIEEVCNDKFKIHIDDKIKEVFMVNYPNSSKFVLENLL